MRHRPITILVGFALLAAAAQGEPSAAQARPAPRPATHDQNLAVFATPAGGASAVPRHQPLTLPSPLVSAYPSPAYKVRPAPPHSEKLTAWPYFPPPAALKARHGAVASVSVLASQVGTSVLEHGGNAIDAAVAMAFALAVVYPEAGNLGGGGFMLVRLASGESAALDYRETAPARASAAMFLDSAGNLTPKSQVGRLAVGIPGTVAGLEAAHKRFGRRPWAELVAPAIRLASQGFIVNEYLHASMHRAQDMLLRFDESRRVYLPQGVLPKAGERMVQPDLARTLAGIAAAGSRGFYQGQVARAIATDQAQNGGVLTLGDLAGYRAKWRTPLQFTYRGHHLITMPLPSSGGVTMAQILNILEGYDLKAAGWHSPQHIHWMAEAERRAYTDRNAYLADPDLVPGQPVETLINKAYAAKRRASIRPDHATPIFGRSPGLMTEHEQTTHFSVVDAAGNAVSNTYTLNGNYGCGVVAPGTGVLLNNEMDDFTTKPGFPNQFGLVQSDKNAIQPGKRMLSSMSPTVVLDPQGRLLLVIGSPGGATIITTVMQVISNMIDFDQSLNWAIAAPRVHHQGLPDVVYMEKNGMNPLTRTEVVRMGHQVKLREPIGDAMGVQRHPDGSLEAFADPRRGGEAFGY